MTRRKAKLSMLHRLLKDVRIGVGIAVGEPNHTRPPWTRPSDQKKKRPDSSLSLSITHSLSLSITFPLPLDHPHPLPLEHLPSPSRSPT